MEKKSIQETILPGSYANYEIILNQFGQEVLKCVDENEVSKFIPSDPSNSEYQAYLKWVEQGNTPVNNN